MLSIYSQFEIHFFFSCHSAWLNYCDLVVEYFEWIADSWFVEFLDVSVWEEFEEEEEPEWLSYEDYVIS